ncbi:MAG: cytochrome b6-f complex iron-sulfur subunit [Limnoraphis robusta]|jgi:cytochrome b6-f complex iron-sulfur subunit|uniref:plastoquinol--plastocyanin reductase n=1 Tax=Limnoraphis robusta CCNP1315 TaxID=3110306 RepID=A0ABU5U7N9_9CYAN|nr:cytochrome b6-f complex iron-sulfur subunit [Limnoraphis robusta]MCG5059517.1 cytochrome b6-f complex iron-sulfur subunit [Limnoraphis sp. WC205]MEA5523189.1 cytochrome b6-f complex iron-sulfur subunit [Limnoraphis robusta CCNP1315]MEA5549096.1 cytochrome b6-f complex iron-sulfur subunit [Limnoraphis robusta CCNP1324]
MDNILPLESPSLSRRQLLNFLTGATIAATTSSILYVAGKFIIPIPEKTGVGGAILAKDVLGNPIPAAQILAEPPGTRALVAGLAGEPTYLIVKEDNTLDVIGIVDNCTHLGCTFPWNPTEQEFQCPCHGSLYAPDGSVIRGPAPLPLKIVQVAVIENSILILPWTETDPRTGKQPWWV